MQPGTLNEAQKQVHDYMKMLLRLRTSGELAKPEGYFYAGIEDFLLRHGQWFDVPPYNSFYPMGAPKSCYGNALILGTTHDLRYVEGLALAPGVSMPVHHAWNLDKEGRLIDNTWANHGLAYIGVEFSLSRIEDALWFDDGTVLDNWKAGFPIFQQPWEGEDFGRVWRQAPVMNALRIGRVLHLRKRKAS